MGLLNKLFKKKEEKTITFGQTNDLTTKNETNEEATEKTVESETPTEPEPIIPTEEPRAAENSPSTAEETEKNANERAKSLTDADELYILLSVSKANMLEGYSFPYVGNLGEGKLTLYLFSTYELARQFVVGSDYEVLDGIHPIGKLAKNDQFCTLVNTLIIARKIMNVSHFCIDEKESYDIAEFLETLNIKEYQVRFHLTNQEAEQAKANDGKTPPQMPRRFNPVQIDRFTNPFAIPEERRKELLESLFVKEGSSREESLRTFVERQSLTENCFVLTVLFLNYMPQAEKAGKQDDLKYFAEVRHMLSMVVWMKLKSEKRLFTLVDPQTKKPIIHNESMCVLYSERFKYIQGNCEYKQLSCIEEIMQTVAENNLKAVVIDGITTTAVIDAAICK